MQMQNASSSGVKIMVLLSTWGMVLSGCASTQGSHRLVRPPEQPGAMDRYSDLTVTVASKESAQLTRTDTERIRALIVKHIGADAPGRFQIDLAGAGANGLEVAVAIKRYDEGNAFARFMLAGLGAMHIDADVAMIDSKTKQTIAEYEVTKTFAWGGIYGGGTTIWDIEDGFASAVAATIAERKD
jgi:hypothetical protein